MTNYWKGASLALLSALLMGGGLHLEVGNPAANAEAKALGAIAVSRVTACSRPGESTVTASAVRVKNGTIERTPLKVVPLSIPGIFAIVGRVEGPAAIEMSVQNPEYEDYRPRLLVRVGAAGIEWSSLKRFYDGPVKPEEIRATLGS